MDTSSHPTSGRTSEIEELPGLYLWQGNGILLVGQREDDRFVLARGWIEHDRLTHVRRWRFTNSDLFSGQVRRLVLEASGDHELSVSERDIALSALTAVPSS